MHTQNYQGPFRPKKNIILASSSPRRQRLLSDLGLNFQVVPCEHNEPLPEANEHARGYAERLARYKSSSINKNPTDSIVLGADTLISFENRILGKPVDRQDALETLKILGGQTHQVITACFIQDPGQEQWKQFSVKTDVKMGEYPDKVLLAYIDSQEPYDKAGSYALQGAGSFLVESITGSYSNVIGLPLKETIDALVQLDAIYSPLREENFHI